MRPSVVTAVLLLLGVINSVVVLSASVPPWEICSKIPQKPCAVHGWVHYNGKHCMTYVSEKKTFHEAKERCHCMGAELMSIHNEDENNYAMCLSFYNHSPSHPVSFWIGGHRSKGEFKFTDGTAFKYTKWAPLEPFNYGGKEDCVELNYKDWGLWNDSVCTALNNFVCIKKN
ncbi:C-type isolectin Sp-CL4-like [Clinocottus analis]|uniref:C-type isolectin Sp-CL4-like n=1 Tax=Clinocottus analis TaxID=304258 RepID=UPI0035BEC2A0